MIPIEKLTEGAKSHRKRYGMPLVTLSYAQSLDGSIAAVRGKPLALSGSASQHMTHRLRSVHDAILVGIGAVLADNPRLTVRLVEGNDPQPVILDSALRFPLEANLLKRIEKLPWIAATETANADRQTALEKAGARVFYFSPDAEGHVPLLPLLQRLAEEGVNSLMVEGGAGVISAFLSAGLVDQVVLTIAPCFVGGLHAVAFEGKYLPPGLSFPRIIPIHVDKLEENIIIWGRIKHQKKQW